MPIGLLGGESLSSSYSSSSSTSPTALTMSQRRRPQQSPLLLERLPSRPSFSSWVGLLIRPRVLGPFLLWSLSIWLVHHYLLPVPLPRWTRPGQAKAADYFLSTAFPKPAQRRGDDSSDSINPLYRPYVPLEAPDSPFPRLRPTRFLPPPCLEQWFSEGEMLCGVGELGEEEKLDATWLWVNGTDPRWREAMLRFRAEEGIYSPEHHFREQNELVHSMRSVLEALPGDLRALHLILADFPFHKGDAALLPNGSTSSMHWRIAQTPDWIDFSRRDPASPSHPYNPVSTEALLGRKGGLVHAEKSFPELRYATHSEIFHLPSLDHNDLTEELGEREWREREWLEAALPTFNSMAIESRIGWVPGLADVTLALNDDFFILRRHAVSDFHSPLYGSVIRFDHGYYQQIRPVLDKTRVNDAGEVGGLYHANHILSKRFPRRLRPYFAHSPKVITRSLHHEASLMFKESLTTGSKRRFREVMHGDGDIQMQWLLSSLRVERWREALLWTYVVANIGGIEYGTWADSARLEIMDMFGLGEEDDNVIKIEVQRGERWTLEPQRLERTFEQAGWAAPKATEMLFSSMDGHMPPILKPGVSPDRNKKCMLDLDRCFGSFWTRDEPILAADMFKRLAFQYGDCGDCLIAALVTASGPLGLSAFFPPKGKTYENAPLSPGRKYPKYMPPPHLPLTPTWQEADFSLANVLSATALPGELVDLREYSMKLLSRYLYLTGQSVSHFHMLLSPEHAKRVFTMINENPSVAILGLNDDIEEDYDEVVRIMNEWFESRWPRKAVWERGWHPVRDRLVE